MLTVTPISSKKLIISLKTHAQKKKIWIAELEEKEAGQNKLKYAGGVFVTNKTMVANSCVWANLRTVTAGILPCLGICVESICVQYRLHLKEKLFFLSCVWRCTISDNVVC